MSDEFIPFWTLLATAEDQLQWGTEPDTMEATARALAKRRPGSIVAESLTERADYLRMMRCQSSTAKAEFLGITIQHTGSIQAGTFLNN
jgi:hypothetical protein